MHMDKKREKRLHMLLSGEKWGMVLGLADELALTVSDAVRQLIRAEHKRMSSPDDRTHLAQVRASGSA